jgi:hypothetical protein
MAATSYRARPFRLAEIAVAIELSPIFGDGLIDQAATVVG